MPDILIIDTSEPFVTTLRGENHQMGHRSEVATTLAEGLTLADREPFDVVFMGAEMPRSQAKGPSPNGIPLLR
jgi:DNA-binding response OmpR family regulator